MIPEAAIRDLQDRNPVTVVAGKWVSLRRGTRAGRMIGPCPLHSPNPAAKDSTAFECWHDGWVCARCQDGGDVIRLVMLKERLDFLAAVEWLGGAQQSAPEEEARRLTEARERKARDDAENARYREDERRRAYGFWSEAGPVAGSPVAAYHELRGVRMPPGAALRAHPAIPYVIPGGKVNGRQEWRRLHVGPAQLAAIVRPDGVFAGLHITWIDIAQPNGKLVLADPKTGEALPAKKVRGSKAGNHIELLRCARPTCLVIGEGIETVLSVYSRVFAAGWALDGIAFRSSVDLGNLAGKAADDSRVPHPTLKTPGGRTKMVPGPVPDLSAAAVSIPDSVSDLRLLGDGDSDPFTTHLDMARAERRHCRPGLRIFTAWPDSGGDFNDMVRR